MEGGCLCLCYFAFLLIKLLKYLYSVVFRSHRLLQQFPLVYKLVPAVALLIFSLWGLVPLVRQGRNILLNVGATISSSYVFFSSIFSSMAQFKLMVLLVYDTNFTIKTLQKNDNGWKNSGTYHIMISYVQPLLLWSGALFICR